MKIEREKELSKLNTWEDLSVFMDTPNFKKKNISYIIFFEYILVIILINRYFYFKYIDPSLTK